MYLNKLIVIASAIVSFVEIIIFALPIIDLGPYPYKIIYCFHETCDISNWFALLLTIILTGTAVYVSFWLGKITSRGLLEEIPKKLFEGFGKGTTGGPNPLSSTKDDDTSVSIDDLIKQLKNSSGLLLKE